MTKQQKNHISRGKRAIQGGHDVDDEQLVKARRSHRELMAIGESKVATADQMERDISRHLAHCEGELQKFEAELRERGVMKEGQAKKKGYGDGAGKSAAGAAGAGMPLPDLDAPAALGAGRNRGRQGGGAAAALPGSPVVAQSHRRGRGRKVSFKEAERQRQAAEAAAAAEQARAEHSAERAAQAAAAGGGGGGYGADGVGGGGGGAAAAYAEAAGGAHSKYPNSALPVAERGQENEPLVGAVAAPLDYTVPPQTKVAARPPGQKEWLLCTVQSANPIVGKYVVDDDDEPEVAGAPHEQYQVISRCVLPLPLYEPQAFTPYNEHRMGATVLALYPDTTCFYKAWVYTPPSERRHAVPRDYMIEFEDEDEQTGRGEPTRVPIKYVLPWPEDF